MRTPTSLFITMGLVFTAGWLVVYNVFVFHFKNDRVFQAEIKNLNHQLEEKDLESETLSYQLKDLQQSVAQLMPQNKDIVDSQLKNFASAVRVPASVDRIDMSGILFEKARSSFLEKKYETAISQFKDLLEKYPASRFTVESQFLLGESYFLKKDFKNSLSVIDEMVGLYPDNELTGYALIRLGQMSEINNQYDEAKEIYSMVKDEFASSSVKQQAMNLIENLERK